MISGAHVPNEKPLVAAIMLTAGRPEMAQRAIRCFLRQTYPNKRRLILDSTPGNTAAVADGDTSSGEISIRRVALTGDFVGNIGYLRNEANQRAIEAFDPELFVHWDDDDVSGPERIEQQVGFLQASGKELVGYRSIYFLDQRDGSIYVYRNPGLTYCVGTSLCYTRRAHELHRFVDYGPTSRNGSDTAFVRRLEGKGLVAACDGTNEKLSRAGARVNPPMIATLHSKTTNSINQLVKAKARGWSEFSDADIETGYIVVRMFRNS